MTVGVPERVSPSHCDGSNVPHVSCPRVCLHNAAGAQHPRFLNCLQAEFCFPSCLNSDDVTGLSDDVTGLYDDVTGLSS